MNKTRYMQTIALLKIGILLLLCSYVSCATANQQDGTLEITQLRNGVYVHTSFKQFTGMRYFPSNGLVVVDGTRAYLVDTAWREQDTPILVQWIEDHGWELAGALITHFHDDRASGIAYLHQRGIPTIALAATNDLLTQAGLEPAQQAFRDSDFSWVKNLIDVYYPGPGHTVDNVVVWLPRQRVLFGGCLVKEFGAVNLGNTADADVGHWSASVAKLQTKYPDATIVVPGHGAWGDGRLLAHTIDLVHTALEKE